MHPEAEDFVRRTVEQRGPFEHVIEIGGRVVNFSVRPLFGDAEYLSLDIADGPGVDVVADAAVWAPDDSTACVVCCEVLEHAPQAEQIVANAATWLDYGGTFIMTCATDPRPAHSADSGELILEGTEFYRNVPLADMRGWLSRSFSEFTTEVHPRGDLYAVAIR